MKYENSNWKLINVDELPRWRKGEGSGKIGSINYKKCVGITLKFKNIKNDNIYNIKIKDYINKKDSRFIVEYVFLEDYEDYKEIIIKNISCYELINKVGINNIIPSTNQWRKVDDIWIGKDCNGSEFLFNTKNKDTEYNILHTQWYVRNNNRVYTTKLFNDNDKWSIHRAIMFDCNKEESNKCDLVVDHINNNPLDNRKDINLRLVTQNINMKNRKGKDGLIGLEQRKSGSWRSRFKHNGIDINTKCKKDKQEAELDNLIAQRYLGCMHNNDQFYRIEGLPEERVKEVTDWLDRQINGIKLKMKSGIDNPNARKLICIHKSGLISEAMTLTSMAEYLNTTATLINKILKSGEPYKITSYKNTKHLEGIRIMELN